MSDKQNVFCECCGVTHQSSDNREQFNNVVYLDVHEEIYARVETFCKKCLKKILKMPNGKRRDVIAAANKIHCDECIDDLLADLIYDPLKSSNKKCDEEDIPF